MAEPRRYVPVVGIVTCVLVVVTLAVPFAVASPGEVTLYYDSGAVNPLVAGLFAVVSVVVFAAGREERSDPELAAGVTMTFGLLTVLVAIAWALTVRVDVLDSAIAASHPWGLVAASVMLPVAAVWYARTLGLL